MTRFFGVYLCFWGWHKPVEQSPGHRWCPDSYIVICARDCGWWGFRGKCDRPLSDPSHFPRGLDR